MRKEKLLYSFIMTLNHSFKSEVSLLSIEGKVLAGESHKDKLTNNDAIKAINEKKQLIVAPKDNLETILSYEPLYLKGTCQAVLLTQGSPENVRNEHGVIKQILEESFQQTQEIEQVTQQDTSKQFFLQRALIEPDLLAKSEKYAVNDFLGEKDWLVVVLKGECLSEPDVFCLQRSLKEWILILPNLDSEEEIIQKYLDSYFSGYQCAFSKVRNGELHTSYLQAWATLQVVEMLNSRQIITDYEAFASYASLRLNTKHTHVSPAVKLLAKSSNLYETFIAYIRNDCQTAQTIQELNIHRNTLMYRLDKIKERTGYDPFSFNEASRLFGLIIQSQI